MPSLFHLVDRAAQVAPERPAIGFGTTTTHTFQALADRAERLAGYLTGHLGLNRGDGVALIMANAPEYVVTLCACWRAGLVPVPMNAKLHPQEFTYMLGHSAARAIVTTPDLATAAAEASTPAILEILETDHPSFERALQASPFSGPRPDAEDLAWLFYTSGTTGRPKGAMLSHRNIMAMGQSYFIDIDTISPRDCILHAAPMSHGSGLYIVPHLMAMAAQVIPEFRGVDPAEILTLAAHWQGASLFAAPTIVNRIVAHQAESNADLSGLKTIIYGGAPMHLADVERALGVLGPRLAQLYGQGESPMCITGLSKRWYADRSHPHWREIIASAGFAQTVVEVAIREDDRTIPTGELGEICVRGETVMQGYWHDEVATADALKDGWLHTGDIGMLDANGFLTLMDRSKDLIISGGSNIYPREVEDVLMRHPGVAEASVVGTPHPKWGEAVVACIVFRGDPVPDAELDALCHQHIARFKRPKRYVSLETLPKSAYGKVLKRALREQIASG